MEKSFTTEACRHRKWRQENQERYLKSNRENTWRRNGMDVYKANELRNKATSCEICRLPFDNLFVDHCHRTGKVRGMLCPSCNAGLGFFEDSSLRLEEAIFYLDRTNQPVYT